MSQKDNMGGDSDRSVELFCGECAQVMREQLPDNSIDLTVTSPPY